MLEMANSNSYFIFCLLEASAGSIIYCDYLPHQDFTLPDKRVDGVNEQCQHCVWGQSVGSLWWRGARLKWQDINALFY